MAYVLRSRCTRFHRTRVTTTALRAPALVVVTSVNLRRLRNSLRFELLHRRHHEVMPHREHALLFLWKPGRGSQVSQRVHR
jgi:hypothetical protein